MRHKTSCTVVKLTTQLSEIIAVRCPENPAGTGEYKRARDFTICEVCELKYSKGPSIEMFRTDAPYSCIISFIRYYMKMTRRLPFWRFLYYFFIIVE